MATKKQVRAAKQNVKKAQQAAGRTPNRQRLYELAKEKEIPGRSKMGKWISSRRSGRRARASGGRPARPSGRGPQVAACNLA